MRLLWIATKSPGPPTDGGRLLSWLTLEGLARSGHDVTVALPAEPTPPHVPDGVQCVTLPDRARPHLPNLAASPFSTLPSTLRRYRTPRNVRALERIEAEVQPDVIHCEQLHALAMLPSRTRAPIVVRAQNVEHTLWSAVADHGPLLRKPLVRWEARRLRSAEEKLFRRAERILAISGHDARILVEDLRIEPSVLEVLSVPFPRSLPPAERSLTGRPAICVLAHASWLPNRDASDWFLRAIWPRVASSLPGAELHLFGARATKQATRVHASRLVDSRDAFDANAVFVVPLRIGSGIRIKILEAWARGVPVVSTSVGARGLDVTSGRELLIADRPRELADAIMRLATDTHLREQLVENGRRCLERHHDATRLLAELSKIYVDVTSSARRSA